MNKRERGKIGEEIVANDYIVRGYNILATNYTIVGGELDIVVEDHDRIIFVEVKIVDYVDDIFGYVTNKKLATVKRTIGYYLMEHPTDKIIQIDVVFVKHNAIIEKYENVTGNS